MTTIERNPDILFNNDESHENQVPNGYRVFEGKRLMDTARSSKIPFGVASKVQVDSKDARPLTIGLVIKESDVEIFNEALNKKMKRKLKENAQLK